MAHTRAARYLRKRLRNLLRRLTPCCVSSQAAEGLERRAGGGLDEGGSRQEIIASGTGKGDVKTGLTVQDQATREQLLATFVTNYVKEIIFNAQIKLYIEDMIIKGSLAIIGSTLPATDDKIS